VPIQTERPDRPGRAEASLLAAAVDQKANHQVLFREVNERIAELSGEWSDTGVSLFVCECSDPGCTETLEISPDEYERARADGARFVVTPGHQQAEVERVVADLDRFLVVETVGAAAAIARSNDPRRHG
jgi:hypothetical protein